MESRADQRERITAGECPILQDIDGDVAEVLSHHGLLPIEEIVTAITDFIAADDVKLCRKYLFESAKGIYYESLENENQAQTVTLRLKSRRGITARATCARDVVQLFCYISGFVNTFPRDILAAAQCPVHTQTQASYQSETTNTQNDEPIYDNDMMRGGGQADMDISRPITELADRCRDHDRAILDKDVFTCYRHDGESVVDFLLAPTNLWKIISKFRILDKMAYSDHCPISFSIKESHKVPQSEQHKNGNDMIPTAYRWDNRLKHEYSSRLNEGHDNELYDKLLCQISDTNIASNEVVATFYEYLDSKITGLFKKKWYNNKNSFPHNHWFDNECKIAKRMLHHKVKHVVSESDRNIYCDLKKNYNRITQSKKRKYQEKIASEIENLNSNDPEDYWRFWKKHKRYPGNFESIDLRSFTDYYKHAAKFHRLIYSIMILCKTSST